MKTCDRCKLNKSSSGMVGLLRLEMPSTPTQNSICLKTWEICSPCAEKLDAFFEHKILNAPNTTRQIQKLEATISQLRACLARAHEVLHEAAKIGDGLPDQRQFAREEKKLSQGKQADE